LIELDSRCRTKKSDSDSQCCQESDSASAQKPPTLYDSYSATLRAMTLHFLLLHSRCTRQQGNCNLSEIFQMLGAAKSYHHFLPENSTATCYDHFAPRKYQLVAVLCLSQWLVQNKRLFRLLFAQCNYIEACYLCNLAGTRLNRLDLFLTSE